MEQHNSKLSFFGGAETVTGSNFLLESADGSARILVDCGFFQGCTDDKLCNEENEESFPFDPKSIDALIVTHGHIDHIGRVPKLVRAGFRGPIFSTPPTKEIAELMLLDSVRVIAREAREEKKDPLYDEKDVMEAMKLWRTETYHTEFALPGGYVCHFRNSGHVLGSAIAIISRAGRSIAFSGDLGNTPALILPEAESVSNVEYLVIESVYGDKKHDDISKRKERLEDAIEEAINRGGALVIPVFSLERTQVLLSEINSFVESGKIPSVPVFLDSPLAIKLTGVYQKYFSYLNGMAHESRKNGDDIFKFPKLKLTMDADESIAIADVPNPKIILAGSGMSSGGRVLFHEKRYLPDPKSTILLIGYQGVGTRGRLLEEGAKEVEIMGENVPVRAKIVRLSGYSGHRDSEGLISFAHEGAGKVEKAFVTMGEPKASLYLAQQLRDYVGMNAIVPKKGETVDISL